MAEFAKKIRNELSKLGFFITPQYRTSTKGKFFTVLSLYISGQATYAMVINWKNISARFLALDDVAIIYMFSIIAILYVFHPESVDKLLSINEEMFFEYYNSVEDNKFIVNEMISYLQKWSDGLNKICGVGAMNLASQATVMSIYLFFRKGPDVISANELPLPFEYIYLFGYVNKYVFVFTYTLQIILCLWIWKMAFCFYCSAVITMHSLTTEVKLFSNMIKNIDINIKKISNSLKNCNTVLSNTSDDTLNNKHYNLGLKTYLKQIVLHHQHIYRKTKIINKNICVTAIIENQHITLILCMSIYYCVKVDDATTKIKYVVQSIVVFSLWYLFSVNGQKLINEGENMQQSLSECSWIDKPRWFKKSLLIMMTRCNTRLEIKPFGVYVIDLRNFSLVVNAAYSYYSLLSNAKQRTT